MYAKGLGVPQDHVLAHKWLNLAAAQKPSLSYGKERPTRKEHDPRSNRRGTKLARVEASPERSGDRNAARP